jgi:hypothetical protein
MKTKSNITAMILSAFMLIISGVQCSLQNPVAPVWETEINVPLLKSSTYIGDFLGDSQKDGAKDPSFPVIFNNLRITGEVKCVDISSIKGAIINGRIRYDLENSMPIGLDTVVFYICLDSSRVYNNPEITLGPLRIEAAETDTIGNVIGSTTTNIDIALSDSDITVLSNEKGKVYVGYYLVTPGTNGRTINVRMTDHLNTTALATVKTKIQ